MAELWLAGGDHERAQAASSATRAPSPPAVAPDTWEATVLRLTGKDVTRCPCRGAGGFLIVDAVPARAELGNVPCRVRSP